MTMVALRPLFKPVQSPQPDGPATMLQRVYAFVKVLAHA
jgi:hypothetical protein